MGQTPSKHRHPGAPNQELSLGCSICGKPALVFESFLTSGPVQELATQQVSEMCAIISSSSEPIRCQSCSHKWREAMEREARHLEQETARNQALSRQASVRSQRSALKRANGGSLRRTGSVKSFISRFRDSRFEDEDYITDHENTDGEGDGGTRLRRNSSRRSVRFAEPRRRASYDSIQSDTPAMQQSYQPSTQAPSTITPQATYQPSYQPPQSQPIQGPPPQQQQQRTQPPQIQTNLIPPGSIQEPESPISGAVTTGNFPRNFGTPPPGPSLPHGQVRDYSYQGPPATRPPPTPGPPPQQREVGYQNPPPGQPNVPYQGPPSNNVSYANTNGPAPPGSYIDMPESPLDARRRELEDSRAQLDEARLQRRQQEARWKEEERLDRETRRIAKQRNKETQESQRLERLRQKRPPPRDNNEPRQPRRSGYILTY